MKMRYFFLPESVSERQLPETGRSPFKTGWIKLITFAAHIDYCSVNQWYHKRANQSKTAEMSAVRKASGSMSLTSGLGSPWRYC